MAAFTTANETEEKNSLDFPSSRVIRNAGEKRNAKKGGKKRRTQKGKKKKSKRKRPQKRNKNKIGSRRAQKRNKKRGGKKMKTVKKPMRANCPRQDMSKCVETAVKAMRMLKDVVANFDKQAGRIEKQTGIAGKKAAKKDAFTMLASTLVTVGGGNKAALSCSGSSTNDGAKQLKNLTDTLDMCMMKIGSACNSTGGDFAAVNMTKLNECKMMTKDFKVGYRDDNLIK